MINNKTVGLLIVTLNEEDNIIRCLEPVVQSAIIDKVLVIDSESEDKTADIVKQYGIELQSIKKKEFNHGATRELGRNKIATDIVIMLSADVFALNNETFINLIKPIVNGDAAVTYARQIPHDGANIFESFPRQYNYGLDMQSRTWSDIKKYGVYTFFCSNSCAAYDNKILSSIGGFKTVLTNEDYLAAFDLLKVGHRIVYVPNSVVKHSHSYTLAKEFKRYFDTGYIRGMFPEIQAAVGHPEIRGLSYSLEFIKSVYETNILLIPYALVNLIIKWFGYKIGYYGKHLPKRVKRVVSQYNFYWDSDYQ